MFLMQVPCRSEIPDQATCLVAAHTTWLQHDSHRSLPILGKQEKASRTQKRVMGRIAD